MIESQYLRDDTAYAGAKLNLCASSERAMTSSTLEELHCPPERGRASVPFGWAPRRRARCRAPSTVRAGPAPSRCPSPSTRSPHPPPSRRPAPCMVFSRREKRGKGPCMLRVRLHRPQRAAAAAVIRPLGPRPHPESGQDILKAEHPLSNSAWGPGARGQRQRVGSGSAWAAAARGQRRRVGSGSAWAAAARGQGIQHGRQRAVRRGADAEEPRLVDLGPFHLRRGFGTTPLQPTWVRVRTVRNRTSYAASVYYDHSYP
eukprot:gene11196-biopygen6813